MQATMIDNCSTWDIFEYVIMYNIFEYIDDETLDLIG